MSDIETIVRAGSNPGIHLFAIELLEMMGEKE